MDFSKKVCKDYFTSNFLSFLLCATVSPSIKTGRPKAALYLQFPYQGTQTRERFPASNPSWLNWE